MSVTLFGSCRISGVKNNNLNKLISYTHSTKEVIQQIKFLLGIISLPPPFDILCFRTGITKNTPIMHSSDFATKFSHSTLCVVEICSNKKYTYDDFYLHHLCVDRRFVSHNRNTPQIILDNFKYTKQSDIEIENDILEIKSLIEHRKLIVVTHYNAKLNGEYIESRNNLITLLSTICEKYNIPIIKPSEVFKDYTQEEVIKDDLGHYTQLGLAIFSEYMHKYTKDLDPIALGTT